MGPVVREGSVVEGAAPDGGDIKEDVTGTTTFYMYRGILDVIGFRYLVTSPLATCSSLALLDIAIGGGSKRNLFLR